MKNPKNREGKAAAQRKLGFWARFAYLIGLLVAIPYVYVVYQNIHDEYSGPAFEAVIVFTIVITGSFLSIIIVTRIFIRRYGVINEGSIIPSMIYIPLFYLFYLVVILNQYETIAEFKDYFITALFLASAPFLLLFLPTFYVSLIEYFKEHPKYRTWVIFGRGGYSRWGSIYSYMKYDFSMFMDYRAIGRSVANLGKTAPIYLGKTRIDYDPMLGGRDIGFNSQSMMLTVAKMGGGKSLYVAWNELLSWQGGAFIFDPKGEHTERVYSVRSYAKPFHVLDPMGDLDSRCNIPLSQYNCFDDIDLESPSASADLLQVIQASIFEEKNEGANSKYFREKAQEIGLGFAVQLLTQYPKEHHHLVGLYNLFLMGDPDGVGVDKRAFDMVVAKMSINEAVGGAAMNAAQTLQDAGEKGELGGIKNSFSGGFNWVNEESLKKTLMSSSFSMYDLRTQNASLSIVIPMNYLDDPRYMRWLRTLTAMGLLATRVPVKSGLKTLFLLDEFAQLGTFKPVQSGLVKYRSQDVKIHMFLQTLGQLKDRYNNYSEFMSSCDKQFFAVNDEYTAEEISKLLGKYLEKWKEGSEHSPRYNERERSLRPTAEILEELREGSGNQYVFPSDGNPMILNLVPFYKKFKHYGIVYKSKFG